MCCLEALSCRPIKGRGDLLVSDFKVWSCHSPPTDYLEKQLLPTYARNEHCIIVTQDLEFNLI